MAIIVPIGTGASVGSGVTTFSGLLTSVGKWLERDDLVTLIPDFITLLEARLNRILRVPEMEEIATVTITDGVGSLPTDFREARNVSHGDCDLQQLTASAFACHNMTGEFSAYMIKDGQMHVSPAGDGEVTLLYYQDIPSLSAENETNWLISKHPDIYLYGTLVHAELYGWNDPRLPLLKNAWDESIVELKRQGNTKRHGGQPLRAQLSHIQVNRAIA